MNRYKNNIFPITPKNKRESRKEECGNTRPVFVLVG